MDDWIGIVDAAVYVTLGIFLLVLARLALDLMTPYELGVELTGRDNPAAGLAVTG